MLLVLISLVCLTASLLVCFSCWRKNSSAHARIHALERSRLASEKQLAVLSRATSRAIAITRLGSDLGDLDCFAQHGEELFLWERLGFKSKGTFIEIGAYNGVSLSNSFFFEKMGWSGVLVEAHPELVEQCRISRPAARVIHAALGQSDAGVVSFSMVSGKAGIDTLSFSSTNEQHKRRIQSKNGTVTQIEVPARTLRSVVAEVGLTEVDWVSVDVEGSELEVLKGADIENLRPQLILVEDNSGGTETLVEQYLERLGYKKDLTIGCNDLYVFTLP